MKTNSNFNFALRAIPQSTSYIHVISEGITLMYNVMDSLQNLDQLILNQYEKQI